MISTVRTPAGRSEIVDLMADFSPVPVRSYAVLRTRKIIFTRERNPCTDAWVGPWHYERIPW